MTFNIADFTEKDSMRGFEKLIAIDGKTVATDGQILARIGKLVDGTIQPSDKHAVLIGLLSILDHVTFSDFSFPDLEKTPCAHKTKCYECDGCGEVDLETDFNEYTVPCKTCGGDGTAVPIHAADNHSECVLCNGKGVVYEGVIDVAGVTVRRSHLAKIKSLNSLRIGVAIRPSGIPDLAFSGIADGVPVDGLIVASRG